MDIVDISKVEKTLDKLPSHILEKFNQWVEDIECDGWLKVKSIKKYRDHYLKGNRKGQRSARLSRSYRIIYKTTRDGIIYEAISKILLEVTILEKVPVLHYTKDTMRWLLLKMNRLSRY